MERPKGSVREGVLGRVNLEQDLRDALGFFGWPGRG